MRLTRQTTSVILVETQGPANIGAVARTVTAFGAGNLILVAPKTKVNRAAYQWACNGKKLLDDIRICATLEEAVKDLTLVLGFTRREGKRRHRLRPLAEFVDQELEAYLPARLGLVFGNEESGLSNAFLDLCHRRIVIPTVSEHGSLNLAHAVSIALYELFGRQRQSLDPKVPLATPKDRALMLELVSRFLQRMNYPVHEATLAEEMTKLEDILNRCRLEAWEVNFLLGILKQVRYTTTQLEKKDC